MEDILTGEIKDYFGGLDDLHGVIRHIDDKTFIEDSLRVLRAYQFTARFNFTIAPETICLCKTMDLSTPPKERIAEELSKALKRQINLQYSLIIFMNVNRQNGLRSICS